MGQISSPAPVLRIMAATSRHLEPLEWAKARSSKAWGPIAMASPVFSFAETDYYESTMGSPLSKCFWAYETLVATDAIVEAKLVSGEWEAEYTELRRQQEPRPLNLDPGYIMPGKLVLASTKDHAHRIYLTRGIFAEVTLYYKDHRWQHREWTFPDYRRADYQEFFSKCRQYLRARLREEQST